MGICEDENVQDISALKKAWNLCDDEIKVIDNLLLFTDFIKENIKLSSSTKIRMKPSFFR
jgi:hypothetical protein